MYAIHSDTYDCMTTVAVAAVDAADAAVVDDAANNKSREPTSK